MPVREVQDVVCLAAGSRDGGLVRWLRCKPVALVDGNYGREVADGELEVAKCLHVTSVQAHLLQELSEVWTQAAGLGEICLACIGFDDAGQVQLLTDADENISYGVLGQKETGYMEKFDGRDADGAVIVIGLSIADRHNLLDHSVRNFRVAERWEWRRFWRQCIDARNGTSTVVKQRRAAQGRDGVRELLA